MKMVFRILVMVILVLFTMSVASISNPSILMSFVETSNDQFETIPIFLNPLHTHCFTIDNNFYAASLIGGKIIIYVYNDLSWVELQRLGSEEVLFTTFQIKEINGDKTPEIIAGTNGPGFIFIYKLDDNLQWVELNSEKYVWSSVSNIMVGKFSNTSDSDLVVQTQEGFVYLLKLTNDSLNIIWKSPNPIKIIEQVQITDLENDSLEEIVVTYKTGGVGVLKVVSNAVTSVWDNYPWGKVLAMIYSDWNNDQKNELILTTSQKVVYLLNVSNKGFLFKQDGFQFDYIAENIIINNNSRKMLTTDTSGKIHLYKYELKNKKWQEEDKQQTGRIIKVINVPNEDYFYLWSTNRQLIKYQFKE